MKLTIGKKIALGYSLAMLFMAITGAVAYRSTDRLLDANEWVEHTFLVIGSAEDIRANLLQLESRSRAYLVNGDMRLLDSLAEIRTQMAESQKKIKFLTIDNPGQQIKIDYLDRVIEHRVDDLTRVSNIRKEKGLPAAQAAMDQGKGTPATAEIMNQVVEIENVERGLLTERKRIAQEEAASTKKIILMGNLLGFGLTALVGFATHRSITRPLAEFQQFVTAVGEGDLTQQSAREGGDELGKLAHGLNQMVKRLRDVATQTRAATENLDTATMEILASAKEQSAVSGEQAAAYQETNVTIQQVSKSGLQIAERAKQVTVTAEAVSIANTSGLDAVQKANQTVEAIHEQAEAVAQNIVALSEKTQMVGDILATVNDIAEQSHLLALNAAIEAAAAGEHGRTFSVVAGEIKNLADQSKAATVQVKTILGDIQKEINTSVMLTEEAVKRVDLGKHQADAAASAIRDMAANIDQSVQAFQQIVAGTNQQQIGFENVMQALKDMSRASEQAATSNRATEKAAANLTSIGAQLRTATERYRL
ncbi:MAG: methyl-accepting chemotaxis protein [Bryobacteraceae bacterium]